jgi:hypothetical protein
MDAGKGINGYEGDSKKLIIGMGTRGGGTRKKGSAHGNGYKAT